jgi:hypothetical protein
MLAAPAAGLPAAAVAAQSEREQVRDNVEGGAGYLAQAECGADRGPGGGGTP